MRGGAMPGILGRHLVRVKPVPIRHGMVSTVTTSGTGFVMEVISPPAIAAEEAFGGGHHSSPSRLAAVRRGALGHRCAACHAMRSTSISLLNTQCGVHGAAPSRLPAVHGCREIGPVPTPGDHMAGATRERWGPFNLA